MLTREQTEFFRENGYLRIDGLISQTDVAEYSQLYEDFLAGRIDASATRSDLGAGRPRDAEIESITQIMWPSAYHPALIEKPYHDAALQIALELLGEDLVMDFDMLIHKAPLTDTPTPWHQDAAYWPSMPDLRAVSCWLALDPSTIDNGCMWYVPGSHLRPLRPHRFAGREGGALCCDASESEGVAIELPPGSCVFHHGHTLHYSRGNCTAHPRRAFIINFRPETMVKFERERGFDHGLNGSVSREIRNRG